MHGGRALHTEPLLCLEFFTSVISISRKKNGIRQKQNVKKPFFCVSIMMDLYMGEFIFGLLQ